jgi:hypothetical protein
MYVTFPSCYSGVPAWSSAGLSQPSRGLGLYQDSNWVTPFRLASDWRSLVEAQGQVSDGWGLSGLGCASCGGGILTDTIGAPGMTGLSMDGSGLFGTGVFGSGVTATDVSTWTWSEYVAVFVAAYVAYSLLFTTRSGASRVRRAARRRRPSVEGPA